MGTDLRPTEHEADAYTTELWLVPLVTDSAIFLLVRFCLTTLALVFHQYISTVTYHVQDISSHC